MNNILAGLGFQTLFDSSVDALLIVDVTGQVLLSNPVSQRLLGYSESEILGLKVETLMPARYRTKHLSYREVFSSEPEKRAMGRGGELYALRSNGQELPVELSLTPLSVDGYAFTLINMQDITTRKLAEAELRHSKEFSHSIINSIDSSIAVISQTGEIINVNQAWSDFALANGGSAATVKGVGMNYFETLVQDHSDEIASRVRTGMQAVLDSIEPIFSIEYPCDSPIQKRWFMLNVTPFGKNREGLVAIHLDITTRKQAEANLKQSREQLKAFIHQAPLSIAMFDREMNYLEYSAHWHTQYGRGFADLIGHNHYEVHPDLPVEWKIVHQQVLSGATLKDTEDSWIQDDGSTHWLSWTALPWLDDKAEIGGIIIVAEDVTTQKLLEMEVRNQRNDLEYLQNLHIASQTVSAIAHEINQPLAAISLYSEVALQSLGSDVADLPTLNRAIKGCIEQSQRAGKSLHELLNFLQVGKIKIEPFDLNDTVHKTLSLIQNDGFGGFIQGLELEDGLPPVLGNRAQISKVLVNLLRNSVEAMQEAGLSPGAINITVKTLAETNMAQVTVQDNGPGLDTEASKRVFEPFFTSKSNGIGLGLSISRSMIEANGGQLWPEPNSEQGATIRFTLPFAA